MQSTRQGHVTVQRLLAKEPFGKKTIRSVKTSDAKIFLIKLQQEDGKNYSSVHNVRGVLRPAFQMAVDDDVVYCKYYEVVYILFHTGLRISELCGLTLKDIDLDKRLPVTEDVADMFRAIIEDRDAKYHTSCMPQYLLLEPSQSRDESENTSVSYGTFRYFGNNECVCAY